MKNYKLIIPGLILFFACTGQNKDAGSLRKYYFPYKTFLTPRTYLYINSNDTSEKMYWAMSSTFTGGDTLFTTRITNSQNKTVEELVEKINNKGALVLKYRMFIDSVNYPASEFCHVRDSLVFKWDQKTGDTITWGVGCTEPVTTYTSFLTKRRVLTGIDARNKQVVFKDHFHYDIIENNTTFDWSLECIYQENKGLVGYHFTEPDGLVKDFKLKK
jgi:hypothetical protein